MLLGFPLKLVSHIEQGSDHLGIDGLPRQPAAPFGLFPKLFQCIEYSIWPWGPLNLG
jgi:hypothetical protein